MFWPPRFRLKHIVNMPCFLACRANRSDPFTLPNLTCLLSDSSHVWEAAAAVPRTSMNAKEHYGSMLLPMAAQTDPDPDCMNWLHAPLSYIREGSKNHCKNQACNICRHLLNSQTFIQISHLLFSAPNLSLFQNLQPSSIFMPWPGRAPWHEMIRKGAAKDSHSLHSLSTLIQAVSSFNHLQVGRVVRGQSSHSTEITVESTAPNWILT